jgi:nucleoid-associated protein YejK
VIATGKYIVVNKDKYIGTSNPFYRSGLEMRMMHYLDLNQNVLKWKYEKISIPYLYPVDGQVHRYIVDFWCEVKNRDGGVQQYLVEIKLNKNCKAPIQPKKSTQKSRTRYLAEVNEYIKNQCKWKSAELYCKNQGWKFMTVTEKDLFNR